MPQMKQGGIEVNKMVQAPIPETAHHALERSDRIDKEVQGGQKSRHERLSAIQPEQPSINGLPMNKGLKMASHVHEVFKTPKR
jgi:hypothetical protein